MLAEEILLSIIKWTVSGSRSWKRTTLPFFSGYLQSSLGFDMFLSNSGCRQHLSQILAHRQPKCRTWYCGCMGDCAYPYKLGMNIGRWNVAKPDEEVLDALGDMLPTILLPLV